MIKLFKYQAFSSFDKFYPDSYLQDKVFFSNWHELNDPLEGYFRTKYFQDLTKTINEKNSIRILSLADTYYNMAMWAHYASMHKGICLEYTIDDHNLPENICLRKITYQDDLPSINQEPNFREKAINILSYKLSPWKYENETRLLYFGEETLVHHNSIKLTGIILGALAGRENTLKFTKIYKIFNERFKGNHTCRFYQGRIITSRPFYQLELLDMR